MMRRENVSFLSTRKARKGMVFLLREGQGKISFLKGRDEKGENGDDKMCTVTQKILMTSSQRKEVACCSWLYSWKEEEEEEEEEPTEAEFVSSKSSAGTDDDDANNGS